LQINKIYNIMQNKGQEFIYLALFVSMMYINLIQKQIIEKFLV